MNQMEQLTDKDFNVVITNIFKELTEDIHIRNEPMDNLKREIETVKEEQWKY